VTPTYTIDPRIDNSSTTSRSPQSVLDNTFVGIDNTVQQRHLPRQTCVIDTVHFRPAALRVPACHRKTRHLPSSHPAAPLMPDKLNNPPSPHRNVKNHRCPTSDCPTANCTLRANHQKQNRDTFKSLPDSAISFGECRRGGVGVMPAHHFGCINSVAVTSIQAYDGVVIA